MNAWPHLPGVAERFIVSALVLHVLGPVVDVVRAVPIILAAFAGLDHAGAGRGDWAVVRAKPGRPVPGYRARHRRADRG